VTRIITAGVVAVLSDVVAQVVSLCMRVSFCELIRRRKLQGHEKLDSTMQGPLPESIPLEAVVSDFSTVAATCSG